MTIQKDELAFQIASYVLLAVFSILCLIPFVILIAASFTNEIELSTSGYSLFPTKFSLDAYMYMLNNSTEFIRAFSITIIVTVCGTLLHVLFTAMLAYPLSRGDMPLRRVFSFYVVLTILINGGLVPTYLLYTDLLDVKNTLFALLLPNLLMNGFSIILLRSYFTSNTPVEMIEAARIDGSGEWKIFWKMVLPISLPMLVTIGLMAGLTYWNDWNNGLIYISQPDKMGIQNLLNRIISDAQFLANNSNLGSSAQAIPVETLRMAVAVLTVAPIVLAYIFLQRFFVKGMTAGAVKG